MRGEDKKLLFVCTGNVCRSPMAEYLFRHRAANRTGWTAQSAGLLAAPGAPASPLAVEVLAEWSIDLSPHRSRPFTEEMANAADLIVVMTDQHRRDVCGSHGVPQEKVALLTSFGTQKGTVDIPDPIGGSVHVYRQVRNQIESAVSDLILSLWQKE